MSFLLDTCVLSELVAKRPSPQAVAWVDSVDDAQLYLSAITVGEIARGIEKPPASARRERLHAWLQEELLARFEGHILSIDVPVMLRWGRLVTEVERQGRTLPAMDSRIAALALHNEMPLVTRNEADFAGTDVRIVNPWR